MDFSVHLKDASRIDADDVLVFRRHVFGDGIVSLAEANSVFALNDKLHDTCPEWDMFFVEVMTDYCVNQAKPVGYVSETNADWLIRSIAADGYLKSDTELELLIKIIERAASVPESLTAYALRSVGNAILEGDGALLRDETLTPGVIGKPEAQLIRRIMYGAGAEGRITISKAEVEALFELNDKTVEVENHPEWNDVFVKAVAAHLMMACGYQVMSRDEVLRREAWLDDTQADVGGLLSRTLSSFGSIMSSKTWSGAFDSNQTVMDEAWRQRNDQDDRDAELAAPVSSEEAVWLAERIGRDGILHENEKALLRYLKQEAEHIDPALQPLLDKVA